MHRKLVLSKDSMVVCDVYVYNLLLIVETIKGNMCYSVVNTLKIKIIDTWLAIDTLRAWKGTIEQCHKVVIVVFTYILIKLNYP